MKVVLIFSRKNYFHSTRSDLCLKETLPSKELCNFFANFKDYLNFERHFYFSMITFRRYNVKNSKISNKYCTWKKKRILLNHLCLFFHWAKLIGSTAVTNYIIYWHCTIEYYVCISENSLSIHTCRKSHVITNILIFYASYYCNYRLF